METKKITPGAEAVALAIALDQAQDKLDALNELRCALHYLEVLEKYYQREREIRTEAVRKAREKVEAIAPGILSMVLP